MDVISEDSPEFLKAAINIEFNMKFDDIDIAERVLMFHIPRNEDDILRIQQKVLSARDYLQEIELTHLNFNNG